VPIGGQVVQFLKDRGRGIPSPSPVVKMGEQFRTAVGVFAKVNGCRWSGSPRVTGSWT